MVKNKSIVFFFALAPASPNFKEVLTRYHDMSEALVLEAQDSKKSSKDLVISKQSLSNEEFASLSSWLKMEWILRDSSLRERLGDVELKGFPLVAREAILWRDIQEGYFNSPTPSLLVWDQVERFLRSQDEESKKYFFTKSSRAKYWRTLVNKTNEANLESEWMWVLWHKNSEKIKDLCSSYALVSDQRWFQKTIHPFFVSQLQRNADQFVSLENMGSGCAPFLVRVYSDVVPSNLALRERWLALRELVGETITFREQIEFVQLLRVANRIEKARAGAEVAIKKARTKWEVAEASFELALLLPKEQRVERGRLLREALEYGWGSPIQDKVFPLYVSLFEEAGQVGDAELYRDYWSRFGMTRASRVEAIQSQIANQKIYYLKSKSPAESAKRLAYMIQKVSLLASENALEAKDKDLILWIWGQSKKHAQQLPLTALANFSEIVERVRKR